MPRVDIIKIEVCDDNKDLLPEDADVANAFDVSFPPPANASGDLNLKVACRISPAANVEVLFKLTLNNTDDYGLTIGNDGKGAQYIRQVAADDDVFLKFGLVSKKPIGQQILADMSLTARVTIPGSPSASAGTVSIIPK